MIALNFRNVDVNQQQISVVNGHCFCSLTDYLSSSLQCFMYEGKTGNFVGQVNDSEGKIHKAGVYGVSMYTAIPG